MAEPVVASADNRARPQQQAAVVAGNVLEVRDLNVSFWRREGAIRAVEGVSLTIADGETLALVGESGSGKSVTSLALMRLLAPEARVQGQIVLTPDGAGTGENLLALSGRQMRRLRGSAMAMIFQEPMTSLNPVRRVGEQIAEAIYLHRKLSSAAIRAEVLRLLGEVGIPDPGQRMASYPHELSGGMRQRVMIAMALTCRPRLLIADEPTTALDVTVQAQIMELLGRLQVSHRTAMLFITHDLALVSGIADRVAVMYGGQIVETAAAADLFADPLHPYTRALLRSSPQIGQRRATRKLEPIRGTSPSPLAQPAGCRFHPRCDHFRPGLCDAGIPVLESVAPGREVRCLRWREIAGES
jgi:oligopeptide/dipeptide ABC transporter ATP-binding protein